MKTNRNIASVLNVIAAVGLTLVNGLLGIVVTRLVLVSFGSDFNGLNATANQIVNVLLVLEGGLTLASNVALFEPVSTGNEQLVNRLLHATRSKFRKTGILFLCAGMVAAAAYTAAVNSGLHKGLIAAVILMTVAPQAFQLFYATTYRVYLQAQQKEYMISFITMLTVGVGHVVNMGLILCGGAMWMVRFTTMAAAFANSFMIVGYVRRRYQAIKMDTDASPITIKGTNDVLVQKITGILYESVPIVFLSVSSVGGTMLASVYAVYNSVFVLVKSLLHGVIDAPRLGIGQMLTEKTKEEVWEVFRQYEFVAAAAVLILLTTAYALILPFIQIYTLGMEDISYYDPVIAFFMVLISAVEMLHIPSGHLLNMAGEFKISRNFQVTACMLLLVTMTAGGSLFGIYGMLAALLLTACALAVMEMGYVHIYFFPNKMYALGRIIAPFIVLGILICMVERSVSFRCSGYIDFFLYGIFFMGIHTIAAFFTAFVFHRTLTFDLLCRIRRIFFKYIQKERNNQ